MTSAGLANFLPATDANRDLGAQKMASATPFIATAANGWSASTGQPVDRVANLTWSGLTADEARRAPASANCTKDAQ